MGQSTRWTNCPPPPWWGSRALATQVDMYILQCVEGDARGRGSTGPIRKSRAMPVQKSTNIVSKEFLLSRKRPVRVKRDPLSYTQRSELLAQRFQ
jgi:hypothetical protein